jgi:NAD(P)-dependent dehydrogenase (short-subunit alcohol dehydrogenase family)
VPSPFPAVESSLKMLDLGLKGKVALVAGAGLGMGESSALTLAAAGCRVACLDLIPDRSSKVAAAIQASGGEAIALSADVRQRGGVEGAVKTVVDAWGRLDVVADVVGQARWAPLIDVTDEDWDWVFDICLRQLFLVAQCAGRQMVAQGDGGALVSISSISAHFGAVDHGPYGAAKAGMISLTKTLAIELAPHRIRVNSIAPAGIASPRAVESDDRNPARRQEIVSRIPLGRRGSTEEIASTVVFLLSNLAGYITGQTIVVDGGASCRFPI